MSPYIQVFCNVENALREVLVAFLSNFPFEAFEEREEMVLAYLPASLWNQALESEMMTLQAQIPFTFRIEKIPGENWNVYWESQFDPVIIPGFCTIRAPFHNIQSKTPYEIIMQPKMSFGTGHHTTTRLMMEAMQQMDFAGKRVLDFGSGTGILAILAAKMGAVFVDAVEIDLESFSNLKENAERNYVDINMKLGGIEVLGENHYETILVNITRNTIVEALPALSSRMMPAGSLLCSGFFQEDVDLISESAEKFGLIRTGSSLGANWSAISFCKK